MTSAATNDALALIDYVLERFHETHRSELPEILKLARRLEAGGALHGLAEQLRTMSEALESHMFKEEMRLFPMMEQGGNSLIGHLIDDMQAEHLTHCEEIARLESLLCGLSVPIGKEMDLAALRKAVAKLFDDLAQHIKFEDEVLFPKFLQRVPAE